MQPFIHFWTESVQKAPSSGLDLDEVFNTFEPADWGITTNSTQRHQCPLLNMLLLTISWNFAGTQQAGICLSRQWLHRCLLGYTKRDQLYLWAILPSVTLPPATLQKTQLSSSLLPLGCTEQTTKTSGPKCSSVCGMAQQTSEMQQIGHVLWCSWHYRGGIHEGKKGYQYPSLSFRISPNASKSIRL